MSQASGLRVSGFPTLTAHSDALGITLELDSFNGMYTHTPGDDSPDGFPVWRTQPAGEQQRFLYFNTRHLDWIFNSVLAPESNVHWAKAERSQVVEHNGTVSIGSDMPWEVFTGVGLVGMALSVEEVSSAD